MIRLLVRGVLAGLLLLGVSSCGDDDDASSEAFVFQEMEENGLLRYVGAVDPVATQEVNGSTVFEFDPADGTVCLDGDTFRMATRDGASDDLVIYLQGGGACSSIICRVTSVTTETTLDIGVPGAGILSPTLAVNPVRDWDVVFVPYCDGSLMSGDVDRDVDDDGDIEMQHGLRNLSAALDVAAGSYPNPLRIVLTGISAGGFATMTALPIVRYHYPDAEIIVVNDAGVGVTTGEPGSLEALASEWNSNSSIPPSCDACFSSDQLMPVIGWQLDRDDNLRVGMITSKRDLVIATTFLMIPPEQFEETLLEQSGLLREQHPDRFKRFIFSGDRHTVLAIEESTDLSEAAGFTDIDPALLDMILGRFDVTEIGGATVADWVSTLVANRDWEDLVAD